ncbi:hypothetical protein EPR50_G00158250 [Xyrichtys novacula]|uniref:Ig-like domain-containing protein n=1 Tax=Xyrichtys novacula TaxID=13765 RepID=A0AAV1GPV4_XYRNO|nr:hypothetical protein EPR50_G00158250 [Xyrichtys novacula]
MLGSLCTLITALTYVDAVIVLTQTPAVLTVSPGQEAVLRCNIQRYDKYYVFWYKQVPGTKLIVSGSSLSPPVLTVFPPSRAELQSNKASLLCLSSQSVPFADVSWLAAGSPVSSGVSTSTAVRKADQTFHISSSLSITPSEWTTGKVFTCKVSLGSQTSEKNLSVSDCSEEGD